jgi:hypothetical protein
VAEWTKASSLNLDTERPYRRFESDRAYMDQETIIDDLKQKLDEHPEVYQTIALADD